MAVIDATFTDARRKPGKIQACTGFEPLTSARYRCSALPIELTSQLGAGHLVGSLLTLERMTMKK